MTDTAAPDTASTGGLLTGTVLTSTVLTSTALTGTVLAGAATRPTDGHDRPAPKLLAEGVGKVFRSRRGEVVALDGVDIHLHDGELVCLLGASGCGKSTLLSIIGGLEEPTSGVVRVEGDRVVGPGPDRGMVFQGYSLFPWASVARNIGFGLELAGGRRPDAPTGWKNCSASYRSTRRARRRAPT